MTKKLMGDQKVTNFKMYKAGKKWVFSSAILLSMLGAGIVSTQSAHADTVSKTTTAVQDKNQQQTTSENVLKSITSASSASDGGSNVATNSTAVVSDATSASHASSAATPSSAAKTTDNNVSDSKDANSGAPQSSAATSKADSMAASETSSVAKSDAKSSSAPSMAESTAKSSSAPVTTDSKAPANSAATSSASNATPSSTAPKADSKAPDLSNAANAIQDNQSSSTKPKDEMVDSVVKNETVEKSADQKKKTNTNKKNDNKDLQAILQELAEKHPELRAGIELLAHGVLNASGTAADGLTKNPDGTYSGKLTLTYNGNSVGLQLFEDSDYVITVPIELQDLFSSPDFKKYITGHFSYTTLGGGLGGSHTYTQDDITISDDGSEIRFKNPLTNQFFEKNIDITITIDLGKAVTDTGMIIDLSDTNYAFVGGVVEGGSFVDWNIFGDYGSTAMLDTNDLMPDANTGLNKPYVVQPVTDEATTVTGTGVPGATITIKNGDESVVLGTGTVNDSGYYSVTIPSQTAGSRINVIQTVNGKDSDATAVIVQHAPVVLPSPTIDSGYAGDKVVTGKGGKPGDLITITDKDGVILGQDYVLSNGKYQVTLNRALVEGETITAVESLNGDRSEPVDHLVTAQAEIPAPSVNTIHVSDSTVSGTGHTAGNIITVKDAATGQILGTAQVQGNGQFLVPISGNMYVGQKLQVIESNGVDKPGTTDVTVVKDAEIPNPPEVNVVYNTSDTVTGTTVPNATVTVKVGNTTIGSGTSDADGNFSVKITPQGSGTSLRVTVTKDGATSDPNVIQVQIPQPSANPAYDNSTVITGKGSQAKNTINIYDSKGALIGTGLIKTDKSYSVTLTRTLVKNEVLSIYETDGTVTSKVRHLVVLHQDTIGIPKVDTVFGGDTQVTGTGTIPGNTINVYDDDGNLIGSGKVGSDKKFTVNLDQALVAGGTLTVSETNGTTTGEPAIVPIIEHTPVDPPVTNPIKDGATSVTGTGSAGNQVIITDNNGTVIGQGTVGDDGKYEVELDRPAKGGETLSVIQQDPDGNKSEPITVTVAEPVVVPTPTVNTVKASDKQITGTATPGNTVTLKDADGNVIATATADSNGNYAFDVDSLTEGQKFNVTQTDLDGNESPAQEVTVQAADKLEAPTASGDSVFGTIAGTAVPGATVIVTDLKGTEIGRATADSDGNYTFTANRDLVAGETLTAVATLNGQTSDPITFYVV